MNTTDTAELADARRRVAALEQLGPAYAPEAAQWREYVAWLEGRAEPGHKDIPDSAEGWRDAIARLIADAYPQIEITRTGDEQSPYGIRINVADQEFHAGVVERRAWNHARKPRLLSDAEAAMTPAEREARP